MRRSVSFSAMVCAVAALIAPVAARADDASLVAPGAEPRVISQGHVFTEGPAADDTGKVFFTDIPKSLIFTWDPETDKTSSYMGETGGANGLYFDKDGYLVMCQGTARQVAFTDGDHNITVMADGYNGKKLNSPNDCWVDPKNGVYFTDPRYGKTDDLEQGGEHVYYITPGENKIIRVIDDMVRPNGLIGSPDGKTLYVADHGGKKTWRYSIKEDGTLSDKKLFCEMGSDGMTMDEKGNIYLTWDHVEVYSPEGKHIQTIQMPQQPANVTFGGKDYKTLVATCRTKVYALPMTVKGAGR